MTEGNVTEIVAARMMRALALQAVTRGGLHFHQENCGCCLKNGLREGQKQSDERRDCCDMPGMT